ncbi:MAG: NAD-dependent epimerase/dehydratase family protein [Alphaproteobacteria bacterium]
MKALVIGGAGPTGPFIINGLRERGYDVAMLHRGAHELPENPPEIEHIHTDPHFRETLDEGLDGRKFDLVIATYGRMRVIADALIGKTGRLIAVGGAVGYRGMMQPNANTPSGMPIPTREDAQRIASREEFEFGWLIRHTEDVVMGNHAAGHYNATMFRYPIVYGPNSIRSLEWPVMKRVQARRRQIILPEGGLAVLSRGYAENMAHAVLLAVDKPEASAGKIYNCADEQGLTVGQWVQMIARAMEWEFEICSLPGSFAYSAADFLLYHNSVYHQIMDIAAIRRDLGYRDAVPMTQAIPRTINWMLEQRPFSTPMDYAMEDRLLDVYNQTMARLREIPFTAAPVHHSYAHPKLPGEGLDHRNR